MWSYLLHLQSDSCSVLYCCIVTCPPGLSAIARKLKSEISINNDIQDPFQIHVVVWLLTSLGRATANANSCAGGGSWCQRFNGGGTSTFHTLQKFSSQFRIKPGSLQLTNLFVGLDGLDWLYIAITKAKLLFHRQWKYETKVLFFLNVTAGPQSKTQALFCFAQRPATSS